MQSIPLGLKLKKAERKVRFVGHIHSPFFFSFFFVLFCYKKKGNSLSAKKCIPVSMALLHKTQAFKPVPGF